MCRVFRLPPKLAPQSLSETRCRHFGRYTPHVSLSLSGTLAASSLNAGRPGGIINKARGMATSAPGATGYPRGSQQRAGTAPGAPHEPNIVAPAHTADKASHRIPDGPDTSFHEPPRRHGFTQHAPAHTADKASHRIPDGPDTSFHEPPRRHGFTQHAREHGRTKTCGRCRWASLRYQWAHATPVNPAFKKSWIEVAPPTSDQWGLGCWVCRQAGGRDHVQAAFSNCAVRRPSKARLMKHQRSDRHKRSVQKKSSTNAGWLHTMMGPVCQPPRWVNSRSC